jgi:hypothetical protein
VVLDEAGDEERTEDDEEPRFELVLAAPVLTVLFVLFEPPIPGNRARPTMTMTTTNKIRAANITRLAAARRLANLARE